MIHMVCGFVFSDDYVRVVLVHKKRPRWQAGRWNGVGGHVQEGESVREAMVREFEEETGVEVPLEEWTQTVQLIVDEKVVVHVFFAVHHKAAYAVKTMTDEEIMLWPSHHLPGDALESLRWLIPLQKAKINWPLRIETGEPG